MANLAHLLTDHVSERADRPAFRVDENVVTYGALDVASQRVAALLRANGLEAGDRVGIMLPNVPYFPIIFYGVLRLGGVMVPMNPLLKDREVALLPRRLGGQGDLCLARLRGRRGKGCRRGRRPDVRGDSRRVRGPAGCPGAGPGSGGAGRK